MLRKCFSLAGVVVVSSSPMPVRSAKDSSVADSSCVEFDLSAFTASDSRPHKYVFTSSWFAPGCGSGAGFCSALFALLPVFDLVLPFLVNVAGCISFRVVV